MTTIVTRAGKGSPLTHTEVDTNFTNLNTNKLETAAIPLGTLAAPSISFVNDANTGIYSPGAYTLAFVEGGAEAMRIDPSGRLLVGTTNTIAGATDSLLQIRGNSSGTQFAGKVALATEVAVASIVTGTDLGAIYFGNTANGVGGLIECKGDAQWSTAGGGDYPGRLVFSTTADGSASPTERMRIKSDGNVSIVTGNLIIGTAGKGIDFSADGQAAGMTSELLDDYEEGSCTLLVSDSLGNNATAGSNNDQQYTKIGRKVTVTGTLTWSSTAALDAGSRIRITGLPFTTVGSLGQIRTPVIFGSSTSGSFNITRSEIVFGADLGQTFIYGGKVTGNNVDGDMVKADLGTSGVIFGIQITYFTA